ncbi:MAG TPA: hypothetical protein VME23_01050 [Terracidiphilus sp.]|nr:hypothetical protein [Terracidiphilus sp.]
MSFLPSANSKRAIPEHAIRWLVIALALLSLAACRRQAYSTSPHEWSHGTHRAYSTNFPHAENPVAEGGNWIDGKTLGLDWSDVRTTRGLAFGTQVPPTGPPFNDSIAVLTGDWNPNQMATGKVHSIQQQDGDTYEEVELLLRMSIAPHNATGYEVNFRCSKGSRTYIGFHTWNGHLNDYTDLALTTGPGLSDGDQVSASIVGNVITAWINGVQVLQAADTQKRFISGNPGMGFYYQGSAGSDSDFGFTAFTASDEARVAPAQ